MPMSVLAPRTTARAALLAALLCLALLGCGSGPETAVLVSDAPEMAFYAELFNASQDRFRVQAEYADPVSRAIKDRKPKPTLVAGRRIRGAKLRASFRSLDSLFTDLRLSAADFYPDLLASGKIEGRQLLLPLSFNLPAMAFREDSASALASGFFLDLDGIRAAGAAFNKGGAGAYTAMGFSPRWDPEFVLLMAAIGGANFQEGKPFSFDAQRLGETVERVRAWVSEANGSVAAEDDFAFKYLYNPGYRSVSSGRILFAYMGSDQFFRLPDDKRADLSFRWIMEGGKIRVNEGITYLAMLRDGPGRRAAEAFIDWIFDPDSQRLVMEEARRVKLTEISFGIAGGFSSLRAVNEKTLPSFYPGLIGHMPPAGPYSVTKPLPDYWPALKRDVILPYLSELCSLPSGSALPGREELLGRVESWLRENPDLP